jgi:hypothetical protein
MKRRRFNEAQIIAVLKEPEAGMATADDWFRRLEQSMDQFERLR